MLVNIVIKFQKDWITNVKVIKGFENRNDHRAKTPEQKMESVIFSLCTTRDQHQLICKYEETMLKSNRGVINRRNLNRNYQRGITPEQRRQDKECYQICFPSWMTRHQSIIP